MSIKQPTALTPKKEFLAALHPLRKITWVNNFIKKVQKPQTMMPKGKNANTEKFILGLSLCLCLFIKNHSSLVRYGKSLKNYTNKHAVHIPVEQAPLVEKKVGELIKRINGAATVRERRRL